MIAEDRIEFLAERYNVLDSDDLLEFVDYVGDKKVVKFMDEIIFVYEDVFKKSVIYKGDVINKYKRTIWISEYSFINIVESDPTLNKIYTQWIILLFINHIKNDELDEAVRLVLEDLVGLNELLSKYDEIKNRKDFIRLARLKLKINLPSDINKFTSIGELFSGVDPFIERDVSDFKKKILNLESIGAGLIMFEDRDYLVFTPFTAKASSLLDGLVNWCTARDGTNMFDSYTNKRKPDGTKSRLYIVFEKTFIEQGIGEIYQFHFESGQYMDKSNSSMNPNNILSKNKRLSEFFKNELIKIYKTKGVSQDLTNPYLNGLFNLGLGEYVFDVIDINTESIMIEGKVIRNMDKIIRLKKLKFIYINNCMLTNIPRDIDELTQLEVLSLPNNKISEIPNSLSGCKNLKIINLKNNKIKNSSNDLVDNENIVSLILE